LISRIILSERLRVGAPVKLVVDELQRDEHGEQVVSYAFANAAD
jgi:hypothetical protein